MLRPLRFVRHFARPAVGTVRVNEVAIVAGGEPLSATRYARAGGRGLPGWVVLHGLSVRGRGHPSLTRFAGALAASGAVVIIPEMPRWQRLQISLDAAGDAIAAAADLLDSDPQTEPGGTGVIGFSFGATQAIVAATEPRLSQRVVKIVGFGGYADLHRTARCMVTGEHEWEGEHFQLDPDPYGRWILAANYLTGTRGGADLDRVARACGRLAAEAGALGIDSGEPVYDARKLELGAEFDASERQVWDLLAPPAAQNPVRTEEARALADQLADAALRTEPRLDPLRSLGSLAARVVLGHGRTDRLVPFTESLRLYRALPPEYAAGVTLTNLFAHSFREAGLHPLSYAREGARFLQLLDRALRR